MDQFYFESDYVAVNYFTTVREAVAALNVTVSQSAIGDKAVTTGYYIPDYIVTDYFVSGIVIVEASADIPATASFTATATRIKSFASNLFVTANITASLTELGSIEMLAFANAAISVQISVLKNANIALTSVFNVATDFVRSRSADADADAVFSAIIAALRSRDVNLQTQAAFSLAADNLRIRTHVVPLSVVSTVTVSIVNILGTDINAQNFATVNATAVKVTDVSVTLTAPSQFNAVVQRTQQAAAQFTATSLLFASKYVGSGRPRDLVPNNTLQFSAPGKYGSHAFGPVAPTTFGSGKLLLPRPVVPKSNQDWVWEGYFFLPFGALTETQIWSFPLGGGTRFVSLTARDDQRFTLSMAKVGINFTATSTVSETRGDFLHLAVVYSNGFGALFVNGVRRILLNLSAHTAVDWTGKTAEAQDLTMTLSLRGTAALDEVSMHHSTTLGFNPQSASLTVPTQPRVNNFATTQFLYHFNNNALDDIAVLESAAGNLSAVSQISALLSGPVRAASALGANFTLLATISHIEGADLVALANSSVTTTADKIKSGQLTVTSACSVSSVSVKTAVAVANITTSSTVAVDNLRIRDHASQFASVASSLSAVTRLAGLFADDLSEFVVNCSAVRTASAQSQFETTSQLAVTAFRIKQHASDVQSSVSIVCLPVTVKVAVGNFTSDFAQSSAGSRTRLASMSAVVVSQVTATGNILGKIECQLFDAVTLTAVPLRIRQSQNNIVTCVANVAAVLGIVKLHSAAINTESAVTATVQKTAVTQANLTSQGFTVTVSQGLMAGSAQLAASSTVTVSARRLAGLVVDITVVTAANSSVNKTARGQLAVQGSAQVSVLVGRVQPASAVLNSVINMSATAQSVSVASAQLTSQGFVLTIAQGTITATATLNTVSAVIVVAVTIKRTQSALLAQSTVSTSAQRRRVAQATVTATASLSGSGGGLFLAQVNMPAALQFVVEIRELRTDTIVYVIPGETRLFDIREETRIYNIE